MLNQFNGPEILGINGSVLHMEKINLIGPVLFGQGQLSWISFICSSLGGIENVIGKSDLGCKVFVVHDGETWLKPTNSLTVVQIIKPHVGAWSQT